MASNEKYKWQIYERWATGPEVSIEAEGATEKEALEAIAKLRPVEGFLRIQQRNKVFAPKAQEGK